MKETLKYLDEIIEKYDLKKKSRKRELIYNRQYFSYFCIKVLSFTYTRTGSLINQSHCTVIYSVGQVNNAIEMNDEIFQSSTYSIYNELSNCPISTDTQSPIEGNENVFLTLINRLFEVKDMADVSCLKAYVNENINPKTLK